MPLVLLPGLDVRPPVTGHLRALHARGGVPSAAYLGNLWRPQRGNGGSTPAPELARDE